MPSRSQRSRAPRAACGVAAALLLATACADANGPDGGGTIDIIPGAVQAGTAGFTPNPLVLTRHDGRTVTWRNNDFTGTPAGGTAHWLLSDEQLFDSGNVAPDASFSFTFPGPGTYRYRCKNHLTMAGQIVIK